MRKIKFGTDGWRAIIGEDYTTDNVSRVSIAVSEWLHENYQNPVVVIGHDCRFGGKLFAQTAAKVFASHGIHVKLAEGFVTTPMVSLGVVRSSASIGVVITASHNPPSYNGYKLKADFGGPLLQDDIISIENRIPDVVDNDYRNINIDNLLVSRKIQLIDLEEIYREEVNNAFDLESINSSPLKFAFDAMYGSGMNIVKQILPNIKLLHCEENPGFLGVSPEPIHRNLLEFSELMKIQNYDCGFATDGDADRIGLYDGKGRFIDSHHLILLLIHYLVKYKKKTGKVITAFSCSVKIKKLCDYYCLEHETVKIGFKHIAAKMKDNNVLLGGEESGGIAINGHIPERDGIWMGLTLFEFISNSGKSINELIEEVYDIVGVFAFERIDLHLDNEKKMDIVNSCMQSKFKNFGKYQVQSVDCLDGYKFFFDDSTWLMIRPSGTEPVLRIYCEANNQEEALNILSIAKATLM